MGIEFYAINDLPPEFVPDPGTGDRDYPITNPYGLNGEDEDLVYDRHIQDSNLCQANIVAQFSEWFQSFFEPEHFKSVTIRTQAPFNEFKSFMRRIYKLEKPFMVIDPRPPELVEDFILSNNMLRHLNTIDPMNERMGAKLIYSNAVMQSDLFRLVYRPQRLLFTFNIMIMESGINNRDKVFNKMLMDIRHGSMFDIQRNVPLLIPIRYIIHISRIHGYDYRSEEFVKFLNSISQYPIRREIRNNGQFMFFALQDMNLHFSTPNFPVKDSEENAEAIEWGARIADSFNVTADLPLEFVYLTKKEQACRVDLGKESDPEAISFISPIMADLDWPKEYGDYHITNRIDLQMQEGDDPRVQILPFIGDYDPDMLKEINEWIHHGEDLSEIVMVHVWPNGSYREIGSKLEQDGILVMFNAPTNKLLSVNIYVNIQTLNLVREGRQIRHIGTIEHGTQPE